MIEPCRFPPDFVWGTATAALQIEGAADLDGKGPSIWDDFCRRFPERIHERSHPEVACDHYHRWAEDVGWMRRLGHSGYRFSLSWPRLLPQGRGAVNQAGLDFYDRLVDALLEQGIAPNVTLYHWDLPLALQSWENPEILEAWLEYAELCFRHFGDRVKLWSTLNEPGWSTMHGYLTGLHPPCQRDPRRALQVAHNLLWAHSRAVALYHRIWGRPEPGQGIGIALNLSPVHPASDSPQDAEAARLADGLLNRWFLEPVLLGRYPEEVLEFLRACGSAPRGHLDFAEPASQGGSAADSNPTVDWLGVNYYLPHHATADAPTTDFHLNISGDPQEASRFSIQGLFRFVQNPRGRYTDWNWEVDPDSLHEILLRIRDLRRLPVYVTENGIGLPDRLCEGQVEDSSRIAYVTGHLQAVHRAMQEGVDVRGYYMWSLMDNFSWLNGYRKRYGLLYVDRQTLQRTPKRSASWFAELARTGVLHGPEPASPS